MTTTMLPTLAEAVRTMYREACDEGRYLGQSRATQSRMRDRFCTEAVDRAHPVLTDEHMFGFLLMEAYAIWNELDR